MTNIVSIRDDESPESVLTEAIKEAPDYVLVFMKKGGEFKCLTTSFPSRMEILGALELAKVEMHL